MTAALSLLDSEPVDDAPAPDPGVPILIVDDNAAKRLALKAVLAPLGYAIVEADSGLAALHCLMAQDFAVILLDVRMSIMDGFETAAHIRQRRQSEMTPIIFITAHGPDEIGNVDLYAEGAVDFIFSPVPPGELQSKVAVFANLFVKAEALATRARDMQTYADQLRLLTDAAPVGIFQTDAQDRYVYTNPHWTEITGVAAEEAALQTWDTIVRSATRAGLISELPDDTPQSAERSRRFEILVPERDSRILLATSRSIPASDGSVAGWVGTLADVTEVHREREAERARRIAEERYRRIVETATEGIWLIDADNRTTFVNDALAAMLRTSAAEMQGRSSLDYCCDEEGVAHAVAAIGRRRTGVSEQHEMKLRRSDGTEMHALISASSFLDDGGEYAGSLSMIRDDTERMEQEQRRHELEERLADSQRLESIGHLAGGIAHDFNNLLLGIRGFGDLALRRLESDNDIATACANIRELLGAAERATQLTSQLLAFGRRQVLQPTVIDLHEVVSDMETLLRQLVGDQVELVITPSAAPVLVEADRTQLEQVITNLVVNAGDAMPRGGSLEIEVSPSPDEGAGAEAVLRVTDNGSGMDAETAARVFEPFFTTKGTGGSGFGLATVHGIVSQSGGRISVESIPDSGSTFSMFLPLSKGDQTPGNSLLADADGGAETILLVEDNESVRTIVTAMLEDRGYRVLVADGGHAAIVLAGAWGEGIDLVVTDLLMPPGPGGRETAERVRGIFPSAKVLYMSGYTDDALVRGGNLFEAGTGFIQKPFGASELARSVREVLEHEVDPA
jgi:two-component system, cell cycle sensor histidine kinase and response regulator CckA